MWVFLPVWSGLVTNSCLVHFTWCIFCFHVTLNSNNRFWEMNLKKKCLSNKVCLWGCGVFCGYINEKWLELSEELSSNKSNSVILKKAVHPMKSVSLHLTCKKDVFCGVFIFYTPTHTLSSSCTQNKKIWVHLWETIVTFHVLCLLCWCYRYCRQKVPEEWAGTGRWVKCDRMFSQLFISF